MPSIYNDFTVKELEENLVELLEEMDKRSATGFVVGKEYFYDQETPRRVILTDIKIYEMYPFGKKEVSVFLHGNIYEMSGELILEDTVIFNPESLKE